MLDIHTHILPEVDDGARSCRQSLQMLMAAREVGIDVLVATPHLRRSKDDLTRIAQAYAWLKPHALSAGVQLLKGYEVSYQVLLDLPCSELSNFCISGTNLLLLELDNTHLFPQWSRILGNITGEGIVPVIAHPERYVYIQEQSEIAGKIRRNGCKLQIDAPAFLKPLWSRERKAASKLLRIGWMDYIASDAHHPDDYKQLQAALRRLHGRLPIECLSSESIITMQSPL